MLGSIVIFAALVAAGAFSLLEGMADRKAWLATGDDNARKEARVNFEYAAIAAVFMVLIFASGYRDVFALISNLKGG